jgi:hypothetical protein
MVSTNGWHRWAFSRHQEHLRQAEKERSAEKRNSTGISKRSNGRRGAAC